MASYQLTNHSSPDHGLLLLLLLLAQPDAEQVRRDLLHAQVHSLPSPDIKIFSSLLKYFFSDRDFSPCGHSVCEQSIILGELVMSV